jgi:hypothetical protein
MKRSIRWTVDLLAKNVRILAKADYSSLYGESDIKFMLAVIAVSWLFIIPKKNHIKTAGHKYQICRNGFYFKPCQIFFVVRQVFEKPVIRVFE